MANFLFSQTAHREKLHGREMAAMLSKQDFDALQALKTEHLQAEIKQDLADFRSGRFDKLEVTDAKARGAAVKRAARVMCENGDVNPGGGTHDAGVLPGLL